MGDVYFYGVLGLLFLVPSVGMLIWAAISSYRRLGQGTHRQRNAAGVEFGCVMTVLTIIASIAITIITLAVAGV